MERLERYAPIIDRIEALARERGLSFDPVYFRLSDSDELAEVASMGLPNRFIHWYWGGAYKELTAQQSKELFSILELVLNTNPSHAFLRADNSYLQNVLVIAHVFGHLDFFKNNHWFRKSNKNMLNEAELHARLIRRYEGKHGREKVAALLDALLTVASTVNAFERSSEVRRRRLIYFLEERAPLEDFERHLLQSVREEAEYFDLIQRTHIINEGWATFVEAELLREILDPQEWVSISVQLSSRPAPYVIGYSLFRAIRDGQAPARVGAGFEAALRVRSDYEDVQLIQDALTEELVQRLDLFVYEPKEKQKSYDVVRVRDMLIDQKEHKGQPHLEVEVGHHRELTLVHREGERREERKVEAKRIPLFLRAVHSLWRNPVRLRANGKVYSYDRRGFSST